MLIAGVLLPQVTVSDHGGSWKRMYLERRVWRLIEAFVPRLSDPDELVAMAALGGRCVRRLEISQLMPPVIRRADKESGGGGGGGGSVDCSEQTSAGKLDPPRINRAMIASTAAACRTVSVVSK